MVRLVVNRYFSLRGGSKTHVKYLRIGGSSGGIIKGETGLKVILRVSC